MKLRSLFYNLLIINTGADGSSSSHDTYIAGNSRSNRPFYCRGDHFENGDSECLAQNIRGNACCRVAGDNDNFGSMSKEKLGVADRVLDNCFRALVAIGSPGQVTVLDNLVVGKQGFHGTGDCHTSNT